jgi:hypothetical protein
MWRLQALINGARGAGEAVPATPIEGWLEKYHGCRAKNHARSNARYLDVSR